MDEVEITMSGRINDYYYFTIDQATYDEMKGALNHISEDYSEHIETIEQLAGAIFSIGAEELFPEESLDKFSKLYDFATEWQDNTIDIIHRVIEADSRLKIEINGQEICDRTIEDLEWSEESNAGKVIKGIKIPNGWATYYEPFSEDHIESATDSILRSEYGFLKADDQLFFNKNHQDYIYQEIEEGTMKGLLDRDNKNICTVRIQTDKFDPSKLIFVNRGDVDEYRTRAYRLFCCYVVYDGQEQDIEGDVQSERASTVTIGEHAWPNY